MLSADGSVGLPHVRVGHCQASYLKNPRVGFNAGIFFSKKFISLTQEGLIDIDQQRDFMIFVRVPFTKKNEND